MIITRSKSNKNRSQINKVKKNKKNKKSKQPKKVDTSNELDNIVLSVKDDNTDDIYNNHIENEKIDLNLINKVIKEEIDNKLSYNDTFYDNENDSNNDFFDIMAEKQIEYEECFLKSDLEMIAEYYGIPKKRKRKAELIQDILLFEYDIRNSDKVQKRKLMFFYLYELNNDKYFKKYLIFK